MTVCVLRAAGPPLPESLMKKTGWEAAGWVEAHTHCALEGRAGVQRSPAHPDTALVKPRCCTRHMWRLSFSSKRPHE